MSNNSKDTKRTAKKRQVKTPNLKRENIKEVRAGEQEKVKGGGGASGGVLRAKVLP